jgi:hypothetical protein
MILQLDFTGGQTIASTVNASTSYSIKAGYWSVAKMVGPTGWHGVKAREAGAFRCPSD